MRTLFVIAPLALALVFAGCATDEVVDGVPAVEDDRPAGKADCPNCDPAGPGAFVQAGINTRWYVPGDKWHVAFQFRNRGQRAKELFLSPTQNDEWTRSGLFLFEYQALAAGEGVFENQTRKVIEIGVTQVDPADVNLDGPGFFESERVDTYHKRVHFRMNDLTDAIDTTVWSRDYPNGRTTDAPSKSELTMPGSVFPVNVPRLLAGAKTVAAPTLPNDLAIVANALDATWQDRGYKRFDFRNGDTVYWAEGYLWPFYIENAQGRGLLIDGFAGE